MANWCSTEIRFYGDKSNDLLSKIKEYTSKNSKENGFGTDWLGNVVLGFGYSTDRDTENFLNCRGSITSVDESENEFTITTETAWCPMTAMWTRIIQDHYSDENGDPLIEFDWIAEEFGCGIYCTNCFETFKDRNYCVDACMIIDGSEEYMYEYFEDENSLVKYFNETFNTNFKSITEMNTYEPEDDCCFISIHELKVCDEDIE